MSRISHFEIPAKDPEKVAAFYRAVFDWEISKWDGPIDYWNVRTGPDDVQGINGGLFTPEGPLPHQTINTIEVDDIDGFVAKVKANGGNVVSDKVAIPQMGWIAYCKDVEGTVFGIYQGDPNAA
ncbi:MAG: VOC family protein [Chloroflexi bacterium]|nr:VOC family protein [Chloroflexota bacterium]